MILNELILALVTLERIAELALARSNTRRLLQMGGREFGRGHYPLIVALHFAWLASLWWLAPVRSVHLWWLALFIMIEVGRILVLASLGQRWTTRIIVVPDAPLVKRGPYRLTNHPNYLVVVGEILVLPLVFGLPILALVFTVLNGALLLVRIHAEDRALGRTRSSLAEDRRGCER